MRYLKTYNIFESNLHLDTIFSECKPFINDLKKCENGSFLVRGVQDYDIDIKNFPINLNRVPTDMPTWAHDILNDVFYEKFGWSCRGGIFTYGRIFTGKESIMEVGYGKSYLLFPVGDYEFVWSSKHRDLYTSLQNDFFESDTMHDDYESEYGEGGNGSWYYEDIDTETNNIIKAIDIIKSQNMSDEVSEEDFEWIPEIDFQDFVRYNQAEYDNIVAANLTLIPKEYSDKDICKAIKSGCEISVNADSYYLVNMSYTEEIINRIWK